MFVIPHSEDSSYYTSSIQFFQRDGLDYIERTDGEKKVTIIVDRSKLSFNEEHLYHLFRLKCYSHNFAKMNERHREDCAEREQRMEVIADDMLEIAQLAESLNKRITRVGIDRAHIKHAFAQENARRGMEVSPRELEQRLPRQQPMPEGVPRLLSSEAAAQEPIQLTDARKPRVKKPLASHEPLSEVLPKNNMERDHAPVKQKKKLLLKEKRVAVSTPSFLESFFGFFLTILNKIKNWCGY